ncbi:Tetratricopeptide-like helical [Penicillium verrucosum]|uniref:Tetratricopeptide-like helical n=1 Tax=Penicillium verrucosum TaxID=60171 RepID=UPI0025450DFA|nr:Tetratricopeptide-like helical [Penicillium verrucosum]KAJ5943337.1 Tetratricopeptide-like helical [Penicillium verrucosum]
MTYLRAEQPGEALEALKKCWQLQNLTEEQIIDSKYPKHSGDIVLLARIKYAQGLKPEAQQLASMTISIRRGLFGDKGPRVADSMFLVARMDISLEPYGFSGSQNDDWVTLLVLSSSKLKL